MGTYCETSDIKEQIKIDETTPEMPDSEIEKRITEAEKWVNAEQDTTYQPLPDTPDLIKYACACYAASLVMDYLFTTTEPNESNQSKRLLQRAEKYLTAYNKSIQEPESGVEKINSEFFE